MKVVAFVPIRLNSKRVIGKNLRELGGKPLLSYVFNKLLEVEGIDEVYAYCSSETIIPYLPEKAIFLKRDVSLDDDHTLGKEIYNAFCKTIEADVYILAHTTSPFIKKDSIQSALQAVSSGNFDSAFSAQQFKTFTWYKGKPLNYQLDYVPRTQDLEPVYIETSAFFIFRKEVWNNKQQRIGDKPHLQIVDQIEGIDIDNPEDFIIAEKFINSLSNIC